MEISEVRFSLLKLAKIGTIVSGIGGAFIVTSLAIIRFVATTCNFYWLMCPDPPVKEFARSFYLPFGIAIGIIGIGLFLMSRLRSSGIQKNCKG